MVDLGQRVIHSGLGHGYAFIPIHRPMHGLVLVESEREIAAQRDADDRGCEQRYQERAALRLSFCPYLHESDSYISIAENVLIWLRSYRLFQTSTANASIFDSRHCP